MASLEQTPLDPNSLEPVDDELAVSPVLRPGQLTETWRWAYTIGWSLIVPALMVLGDASHSFGKPAWWLDRAATVAWWTPLPFLVPIAAAVAGAINWRHWPIA